MTNHTIDVMVESLETLNPEVDESLLAVLEKTNIFEWSYQIKWNENINSLQSLPFSWQDESKLLDAAYYSSQIINRNGQKFVNEVYHCVKTYPVEQNIFLSALKRLYTGSLSINIEDLYLVESSEEASRIFGDNFIHHGIRTRDCILSIMKADSNTTLTEDQVRTIESILAQINKRSSKPSTVLTNTTEEDEDKNEYTTRNILSFTQNDIKVWSQVCKQKLKSRRLRFSEIFTEIAAVIERAITLKRGYGLRNTQKISIISFLFDLDASHKGILQQMSTGEGKTIVIVVLSILKVLQGEKVDIITSSSVLAKRDSEINKDIFDLFEISVSNNCSEDKHDRQDAYLSFVVYGEIGTFQRDILLTEFYDENIIGGRYRENVIVDEVDSMLLDRGETVLYLSHEIAGIDAIEFVYTYIWSLVNSKEMIGTDDDRKSVRQCMLDAMYGMISMTDISKCFPPENTINVHEIWNKLKKENIIDSEGRLLTRSYARFNQLGNNGTTNDGVTAGHVISMLKDTVRKGILVEIPKFLESFINRHLDTWIRNAFNAKYMEEGKHFIIDIDRTENDRGKDVNIVIMDIDTGTEQYHMQWNSGLHQFLQLKYKCAISSESLKAVFMSNISFFRLYNNLFGLTGTLGSQKERDLLKDMYNVSYITIPTFQEPKFVEHDTYLCDSTDKWVKLITETAVSLSKYRPKKNLSENRVNAHVYKNSYCELSILKNETELESGCIILATNLAGRGTDIRISEDISVLGGLHVILTYLPSNLRIEEQAFGRAARKGQHGSGQLIICECMEGQHKTNEILTISRMKIQRDTSENERISKIQQRYETFIRAEERLFRKFQTFYDKLKQTLITKQTEPEFQKVILQALLDRWAFWLDSVETSLEISGNFSSIKDNLIEFLQEIDVSWVNHDSSKMTMMLHSPSQLVKAGKAKTSSQEYNNAQTFFDKVIDCDPSFSESALYYKVHCLLKRGDFTCDDFKIVRNIFGICKYLIEQRIEKLRNAVQIVNVISSQYTNKREIFTVSDGYVQQKENAIQIYYQIIDSIDSMNGYAIEPTMFVDATCGHLNANMIFRDLDTMGILSPHKVRVFPPEKNTWQFVTESYELYSKEIYSKLNQLKDKTRVTADDFQDILPSREELWIFLIDQGVLKDTKDYILLHDRDFQRSRHIIPMQIIDILKSLECKSVVSEIDIKKHIFLYSDQKDKILAGAASLIRIDTFKDDLGFGQIFEVLKREKVVSTCSFALLAPESEGKMLHSRLPKFDHVGCNTFVVMGVSSNTSKVIFDQLVANEVLSIDGRLLTLELGSIWLSSFSNYTTEVRNIVAKYSKYRICTFHLLKELELPIDLFSRPHDILFGDLLEAGVVTPFKVKGNISEKEMTKQLKFLYGHECDKKKSELIEIVSSRIESGKCRNFTRSETKVLYDEGIYLDEGLILGEYFKRFFSELPKILSSEIYDLCHGEFFTASEIERDLIDKMICVRSDSKDLKYLTVVIKNDSLKKTSLKQELRGVENEIKCFISSRLQNYQNTSGFVAKLESWREGLAKFDNVDTELRSLADSCTEEQLIGLYDEILSMTNNGFGDLLVIKERKWTFKSVFKMFCILAIGLIQIGLALAIEFYSVGTGTFVANALLSEGVGDIMFAVECMISGHCTMQSYLHHKALSVAITVASAGIGAFAARGSKFSRFGNKIGGQFLQNQSGSALLKQGVAKRLLAKAAAKRIGKKLVEVASMKLVDKGVDFVIEKTLRASLVQFCGEITKSTPKVALKTIEILTESLSTLVRKVGKQNAEQIVEKFINKCLPLQQSDVSMILSKFGQIANAFGNGLGEAMEKLGHSGDSRMETLSKIAKIVNVIGKGIKIVNAVQEVGTLRSSILEKFNNEIVAKLQFEDGDVEVKDCESWASAQVDNVIKKVNTEVTKYLEMQLEDIVVKPLLQKVGYKITRQITKSISKLYRYGKTCLHQSDFNRLKAGHESELQQAPTETKDEIKLQYTKKLLKLLKNTRDPNLFADIVKEGIPLGIHSVQAVSEITGAVINIETIGGDAITMPQKFTPCGKYCGEQGCITLQFHVNPETGIGHFISPKSMDGESRHYDCLLEAVTQETGMPLQRDHIAETIRTHPEIRRNIKQGIHEHFIIKGGSGGVVQDRKKNPTSMEIIEQGRLLLISKQTKEDKILMELEKRGLPTTRQNKNQIWEEMKNENENGEIEISRQIKKSEYFFKSQRDKSKLSNNSEKATGNDELFETRLLVSEIAQSCVKNSPKYVEPTEIQFGDKSEDVDYLKAYYHCRFDTRYVVFIREGKLQGHAGALFSRSKDAVLESNEEGVKIKTSNVGGLTSGSKDFHKQRTDKVWECKENHLFSILNGIQKHVEMLPTKKQLENMDLSNCYSPMGYHLDVDDHRDKFIIGLEREKYKLCIAAEHLIHSNRNAYKTQSFQQFERSLVI
ncbi:preprotein translocase subunit SecA [Mytilus galloprovincialis]|uniref:Preprotein translocase subunit SecA n=1 Tax=Mytilus galloprovincialis TaxID=29158 RepID=A0A8B6CDP5_MYTGA|nr:preprotein translocase subunit SecA [Mytilus galloprovincialis]